MLIKQRLEVNDPLNILINELLIGKTNLIGIEIGIYRGESTKMFLDSNAFKTLYCIDPWEPGYNPNDLASSPDIIEAEKDFDNKFKNNEIIKKIKQKSDDAVSLFEDNSIDFVYIDGNHQCEFVKNDIKNYYLKVKRGGIISGHDYRWPGLTNVIDEFFKDKNLKIYPDASWVHIKE